MSTITPEQAGAELAKLEESRVQAWQSYNKSLQGLNGKAYDEAEGRSWARLQRKLTQIEGQRAELDPSRTNKTR